VRDVVSCVKNVETITTTAEMLRQYCAAHQAYVFDLEATSTAKHDASEEKQHDEEKVYQKRKNDIEKKQADAQQLISEPADRLTKATSSKNMVDILAAPALLQCGNKMLADTSEDIKALGAPPYKKTCKA
jgi:hypothetical protein